MWHAPGLRKASVGRFPIGETGLECARMGVARREGGDCACWQCGVCDCPSFAALWASMLRPLRRSPLCLVSSLSSGSSCRTFFSPQTTRFQTISPGRFGRLRRALGISYSSVRNRGLGLRRSARAGGDRGGEKRESGMRKRGVFALATQGRALSGSCSVANVSTTPAPRRL